MDKEVIIVLTEDDEGHAKLIKKNLLRAGVTNKIIHFSDGEDALNFFFRKGDGMHRVDNTAYLLLLDIKMKKVDGIEVLEKIKADPELQKIPVIMLTTTDDPREIEKCHELGCNSYVTKPIDHTKFIDSLRNLGLFLKIVHIPQI